MSDGPAADGATHPGAGNRSPAPLQVVIAGGGTGGHGFPALALAQALTAEGGSGASVRLVGTSRGPEGAAAAAAGIDFEALDVAGFRRSLRPQDLARNLVAAAKAARALLRAMAILRRPRVDVAVGTGGYASLPVAVAALLRRVPLVLQEQNALPGRANLLAGRWAASVAVSFPGSERCFAGRARVIGNPVRPELAHLDKQALRPAACATFGLDDARRTLLVFGGSQGARRINAAALGAYAHWREREDLQVLHLVGAKELPTAQGALAAETRSGDGLLWKLVGFTDRMDLAYAIADLAVTRAGAATMFEIAAAQVPAIVVPYPHAGQHQRHNAQPLLESHGIEVIEDEGCTPDALAAAVDGLLDDAAALAAMRAVLGAFARPDAAGALADLVLEVATRR